MPRGEPKYDPQSNLYLIGILPERNFRFIFARATAAAREVGLDHGMNPAVTALMGETILGAFFIAGYQRKQSDYVVSLHLECRGPVNRLIAFAGSDGAIRGYASRPEATWAGDNLYAGKGDGILNVNLWSDGGRNKVYGSSVEMRDVRLDRNVQEYMARSDQVQSFVGLQSIFAEDGSVDRVSGYLFQALPGATADDIDAVLELLQQREADDVVADFVGAAAMEGAGGQARPIPAAGETVQVLRNGCFYVKCDCSRHKISNMLFLLGKADVEDVLRREGRVEVFCEFCKKRYEFDESDVRLIFETRGPG